MRIGNKEAAEELLCHDNIVILTHQNPDGDTLGSGFALYYALTGLGKTATLRCADPLPNRFSYLYPDYQEKSIPEQYIVAVDVADLVLLGSLKEEYEDRINLCIDHHPSNSEYAEKLCLHVKSAATCELLFQILEEMQINIDTRMADCLYTGLATDCGCFKYSNTTAHTHLVAAKLLNLGANLNFINEYLFDTKSKARLVAEQKVLQNMEYYLEDKVALTVITKEIIEQTGVDENELDGVSAIPRSIEGVEIGVTIREKSDNIYKISVRTGQKANASKICSAFSGGGHARAAGCMIKGDLSFVKKEMVNVCKEFI